MTEQWTQLRGKKVTLVFGDGVSTVSGLISAVTPGWLEITTPAKYPDGLDEVRLVPYGSYKYIRLDG